jgi:hypothetical protein
LFIPDPGPSEGPFFIGCLINGFYWSGALARILSEKKQVHHKVRSSLDSQDAVELEAAIYAAER